MNKFLNLILGTTDVPTAYVDSQLSASTIEIRVYN